ncbi:MAG: DUF47 domain-containing protein, partial [Syntrophomonadaceae bacterium]
MSFRLKPRDDQFFEYFDGLAEAVCEAALILKNFVEKQSEPEVNLNKINGVEEKGDQILSTVM